MTGEAGQRVCPFCGEPPGGSAFCTACGRNLTSVQRLPTRAEWARAGGSEAPAVSADVPSSGEQPARPPGEPARREPPAQAAAASEPADAARHDRDAAQGGDEALDDPAALAARCAEATAAFLAAMRAAGNPGVERFPTPKPSAFRRAGRVEAWVLWPVDREDFEKPRRYEPGLVLTVDGRFHQLDSELRGWGQRNFPYYAHTASLEPVEMPVGERLLAALAAVRAP